MYLHTTEDLSQIPTPFESRKLPGPKPPPQCQAIPEKYRLRDSKNRLTSGMVNCPTRADAARILSATIARAARNLIPTNQIRYVCDANCDVGLKRLGRGAQRR